MFETTTYSIFPFLFGAAFAGFGSFHQVTLLGSIPTKIHYDIFGATSSAPVNFASPQFPAIGRSFFANPPLSFYPLGGTGFARYAFPSSNFGTLVNNISSLPKAENLFTPAVVKYPAATKGQLEAYEKALVEEANEVQKELDEVRSSQFTTGFNGDDLEEMAVSYVNVRLGGDKNVNYQYSV